jgi:hypothetical protein
VVHESGLEGGVLVAKLLHQLLELLDGLVLPLPV